MKETPTVAYKLFSIRKDKSLGSLFIHRRQRIPIGVWMKAEDHPTSGYANRPGWHCTKLPTAPHLSKNNRVWCKVLIKNFQKFVRPNAQGGVWLLAEYMKVQEILDV